MTKKSENTANPPKHSANQPEKKPKTNASEEATKEARKGNPSTAGNQNERSPKQENL